ncbi:hypothetical protein ACFRCR_02120 [Oerskovia sp. NPDC056781]|uniref:hypothetical protein n=1 Tax=Oerskovia sp. NPDC056781 TaxID=3345942 RepID=UPI00366BA88D
MDILDLRSYLRNCVIRGNYRISDELNSCIFLSPAGDQFFREMLRKKVPTKEARLTCFLEFYHLDLFVDIDAMNPDALASAIGAELKSRAIMLPFVHGPELYGRAADLFPEEKDVLGTADTLRLIADLPVGVFQMGIRVSGPFGLLQSSESRGMRPTLNVPMQHCHDVSCRRIHRTVLSTDSSAAINNHRATASKILEAESDDPSAYAAFFAEISDGLADEIDDFDPGALPLLLGDGFSVNELRRILSRILDRDGGMLRASLVPLGFRGKAVQIANQMTRAELLQCILLSSDHMIAVSIDELVFDGSIAIPVGEVRRPVMFAGAHSGRFAVVPEVSCHGLRFRSESNLGPLRLRRLVDALYPSSGDLGTERLNETEELGWQLRSVPGMTVASRLDEYLRTVSPVLVLKQLVLASKKNLETAKQQLNLADLGGVDDDQIVDRMLWKLGFEPGRSEVLHEVFWTRHERLTQAARSASVSTIVDQELMRGLSANYFVALEELLADSLFFSAWVLTADHTAAEHPFRYHVISDRRQAQELLSKFDVGRRQGDSAINFGDKMTLYPLCQGFAVLADYLELLRRDEAAHVRPQARFPQYSGKTNLQRFPFRHSASFLDLVGSSQLEILGLLREISKGLMGAKVYDVRNEQLHYRRSSVELDRLIACLEVVEHCMIRLEGAGLARTLFFPDRREVDRWGRATIYFSGREGREVALGRPSSYAWLNLPSLGKPQYLVSIAQFAEPNEILRVSVVDESEFLKDWAGVPKRRIKALRGEGPEDGRNPEGTGSGAVRA